MPSQDNLQHHIIDHDATILDALRRLNSLTDGVMTLVTVDSDGFLRGTVTDGDIRRALLRGASTDSPISVAACTSFTALKEGEDADGIKEATGIKEARGKGIKLLPAVDSEGKLLKLLDLTRTGTILPLRAILMAGGKGERLRPLTLTTPKPLLEIGGMPIIDYNIRNLARVGITDVTVTTRYLAGQIREHFSRPRFGIEVKCVLEEKPLGTIGAASLIPRPDEGDTLVMNSDLLTTLSLEEMFLLHKGERADVTIAAIPYTVSVPYAILATEGKRVLSLEEKPTYSYYANGGIYIFSNRVLNSIEPDTPTDAPELIGRAIAEGKKVIYYPVDGTWIDIGTPTDFRHAEELMRHHRQMSPL